MQSIVSAGSVMLYKTTFEKGCVIVYSQIDSIQKCFFNGGSTSEIHGGLCSL